MQKKIKQLIKCTLRFMGLDFHSPIRGVNKKQVNDFFKKLDDNRINYVVLRWYDSLPYAEEGEDFDILVSDEDCKKLTKQLRRGSIKKKDFIKCDVFPKHNAKGLVAYYPPHLAELCLENRIKKNGVWILNNENYFFSLTYHALIHKGYSSGIGSKYKSLDESIIPEHNYADILDSMANGLGIETHNYNLEDYLQLLDEHGWMPPIDIFFRRSQRNPWLYDYLLHNIPSKWFERYGVACFVVRELGNQECYLQMIYQELEDKKAVIIVDVELNLEERTYFAKRTRGGDWGKGPCKVGGGLPGRVIIVKKDMGNGKDSIPHGVVEYEWVKEIKNRIRDKYNKSVPHRLASNILHSTDNGVEASYYISVLSDATGRDYNGVCL